MEKVKLPSKLETIIKKLDEAGFEIAIVGGAVRDLILGKQAADWDLATSAKPEDILKLFPRGFYNNRFGTVGIPIQSQKSKVPPKARLATGGKSQKLIVQITTYRKEEQYSDKRHPDVIVWGKNLEEDLARRDFTINAMALRFSKSSKSSNFQLSISNFQLVDPFKGKDDFKNKIMRTVGDPDKRFSEDALRLLRAVRFATTLNFKIEEKTLAAVKKNAPLLSKISGERIREEVFKIIDSSKAAEGIFLTHKAGLLSVFLPELNACFEVEQKSPKRHHIFDVGTHCVKSLAHCPSQDTITKLATLLHDIGKAKVAKVTEEGVRTFYNHEVVGARQVLAIAKRWNLARVQRDKLYKLVRYHQFTVNENQTDRALRRFIRNIGTENIEEMMDLRVGDRLGGGLQQPEGWRLKLFRERLKEVMKKPFTVADLKVDGHDVMKLLGLGPGPRVGEILSKLFEEVAENPKKNNREYLLDRLNQFKKSKIR